MDDKAFSPIAASSAMFDSANQIEITRKVVRFGSSIFQLKNMTGLEVGQFDRQPFSWLMFWSLIIAGAASLIFFIGVFFIALAFYLLVKHRQAPKSYGLEIEFSSGQRRIFKSHDREFLCQILDVFYQLMSTPSEAHIYIDMDLQSVNVSGHWPSDGVDNNLGNVTPLSPLDDS